MVFQLESMGKGHCYDMRTLWDAMIVIVMSYAMLEQNHRDALVVRLYKSLISSCVRKPWKMMDHPRDYITDKGMLEPGV